MFSCEFCKILRTPLFSKHLKTIVSDKCFFYQNPQNRFFKNIFSAKLCVHCKWNVVLNVNSICLPFTVHLNISYITCDIYFCSLFVSISQCGFQQVYGLHSQNRFKGIMVIRHCTSKTSLKSPDLSSLM